MLIGRNFIEFLFFTVLFKMCNFTAWKTNATIAKTQSEIYYKQNF